MSPTEDFLTLDSNVRNCQTNEAFEDCTTRNYLTAIYEQCNCIPYNLKNANSLEKVQFYETSLTIKGCVL